MFVSLLGALVATATPTTADVPRHTATAHAELREGDKATPRPGKASPPDMATLMRMIDKFFPAQAEPDPARLALARTTVQGLLPPGSFGTAFGGLMGGMFDRLMGLSEADFAEFDRSKGKAGPRTPASTRTLRQSLAANDPHFEERLRLTRAAVEKELAAVSAIIEPRMREGMARAIARKLDQRQLADANAFLATDSGRALGREMFAMWVDPDLFRSMVTAMPEMMAMVPGAAQRIGAATAHLPKPPKAKKPPLPRKFPDAPTRIRLPAPTLQD